MTKDTKEAPREIWLQGIHGACNHADVTWCEDSINDDDVRYVRADFESGEAVARIKGADEYGPLLEWTRHWVDLIGKSLYLHPPRSNEQTAQEDREAFEASGITSFLSRSTEPGYEDEYADSHTQFAWRAWTAALEYARKK